MPSFSGLTKEEFLDGRANSIALAIGGTYPGFSLFILKFLLVFRWFHATILLPTRTASTFYPELARDLLDRSQKNQGAVFSLEISLFESDLPSMTAALTYANSRSRGKSRHDNHRKFKKCLNNIPEEPDVIGLCKA